MRLPWGMVLLAAAALASALGVVYSKHLARQRFAELQGLYRERDALDVEWGRLLLEQSTWGALSRVERLAKSQLHMVYPAPQDMVVLKP